MQLKVAASWKMVKTLTVILNREVKEVQSSIFFAPQDIADVQIVDISCKRKLCLFLKNSFILKSSCDSEISLKVRTDKL